MNPAIGPEHDTRKLSLAELRKTLVVATITALQEELALRLTPEAAQMFAAAGKDAGDITFTTHGGLKFKASVSKTVKWDGAKLQAIAAEMEWPAVQRLFKIDFGVAESTYKAIIDDGLRAKLDDARTTKLGDLKITIIPDKKD
jgi:hypothetical protein